MPDCQFCAVVGGGDAERVWSDEGCVAFLDIRPLFPGHTLVVPRRHVPDLDALDPAAVGPLFGAVRHLSLAVAEATGAAGTFVAINNRVSQSVPHLHVHVVPRSKGDGLRGFFWPRQRYQDRASMAAVADAVASAAGWTGR